MPIFLKNIVRYQSVHLKLLFALTLFMVIPPLSFAGHYVQEDLVDISGEDEARRFVGEDKIYYLDASRGEIRIYNLAGKRIKKISWEKTECDCVSILVDENGSVFIFSRSGKGLLLDGNGNILGKLMVSSDPYVSFHGGVVYDTKTGEVFFKLNSQGLGLRNYFLDDFEVIRNTKSQSVRLLNKKNKKTIVLPKVPGFKAGALCGMDSDNNIYFSYESSPSFDADLNKYHYKFKTLVFDREMILVQMIDAQLSGFNEKTKGFISTDGIQGPNGKPKYIKWKYVN